MRASVVSCVLSSLGFAPESFRAESEADKGLKSQTMACDEQSKVLFSGVISMQHLLKDYKWS